ncbi:transcription factor une10 [Phtheirospermum japonicum]|uniref:Transcription factor une10 n=1 Tax=Phtheirospermum japonicum TaxID=374723 RepID=A0A830D5H6_9LAMI|nr:transcription factor une10 [Phtheirospermum japonicum]
MSQCVPSWDLDNSAPPRVNLHAHSNSANSLPLDVPSLDYEQVAELTWENGQLAMHGLAATRVGNTKPSAAAIKYAAWDKPRAGGTLESIVNQATTQHHHHPKPAADGGAGGKNVNELVPWFDHHRAVADPPAAAAVTMDALVPCNNNKNKIKNNNNNIQYKNIESQENSAHVVGSVPHVLGCSTLVGSCSGAGSAVDGGARGGRAGICKCGCASESATGRLSRQVTADNTYSEREFGGGGLTSTSLWSPENTSSGGEYTRTSAEEHDSVCHSRSQACNPSILLALVYPLVNMEANGDCKKKATGKSSASTKSRAAAIHNQSERTDKASMLDEVIEYLKQLQAQVHMMSRMNMPSMMMPLAMQQQLQMSMMAPAAMGMGMGVMDMTNMGRAPGMPPAGAFVPMPSWDIQGGDRSQAVMPDLLSAFLACQSQPNPMTIDAYSRLAALYQQFQPPPASGPKN